MVAACPFSERGYSADEICQIYTCGVITKDEAREALGVGDKRESEWETTVFDPAAAPRMTIVVDYKDYSADEFERAVARAVATKRQGFNPDQA